MSSYKYGSLYMEISEFEKIIIYFQSDNIVFSVDM